MNNKLGMAIARILSTTRLLTTIGLVLFCLCQSTLETAFAQGPVAPPAPPVPAAPVPVPDPNAEVAETQFIPDYGDSLWNKTIEMPSGEISPETNKQPNPSFDVNIWSLSGALIRNNEMPTLAANPGKNFLVQLVVNYRTLEPTKLFANLKLDKLLTPEEAQKLMKFHSRTWHYDNQSSPGATAISSPGSQWITLIGTAPKEEGEYEFFIDVGLMPMQTGGLLKKLYKVKLVTKFEKPIPLNPTAVAIHSESKRVAVGEMNGTVRLLNAEDGSILQTWPLGNTQVQSLAFTESGTQLAVGFGGPIEDKSARSILVCSTTDGTKQTIMPGHNGNVNGLHFVKDGRLLSCGDDGQVMLWDAVSGQKIASHTVGGPARGLSYCESTNCACVVNNGGVRVDVEVDVVKRLASMEEMQTELRTRTVNRVQIEKKTSMREVLIDFEGRLRNVTQEVSRMVPVKKDYTEEYTVSIPVVKTYEETFSVTKPKLSYVQPSENSAKAVIQLSLPDLDIVGRWIPEGDRIPVGTSFNSDGSRIFVTTLSGVSALESKSMIELVDIRAKDDSGEEVAETVHHQSPFYIADREMLLTPNLNKLVSLKPDTKVDDAYFDDLAKSAKAFREQSLEQAKSAASRLPSITPSQSVSPGYGPQPPAPAAPKPQLKPLLAKVEAEKAEVKLTEYNFNELGLDEPIETNPKSYRLAELDHTEVIVADGVHSTKISLPEGFSTFSTLFGLPDNLSGTAHFVVRGDGRTIYRSNVIRDHRIHGISLDVRGVKRLELAVETMNRKSGSVAALWLEPTLHRKLLPDVYTMRFEELRLKIEKFVGLDFRLDRNGLTTIGVLRSDPTVTTTGGTWRPKTNRTFAEKDLLSKLRGDLNFAHARVYLAQDSLRNGPDVAYSYHSDHVRVQCLGPGDCELIIQIPYRTTEEVNAPHEPRWTGKWRVGVWNYSAEERVTPTKDIPPKGEKPLGVLDVESIDWEWNNEAFPSANAPNDRFLMVGERKFESSGGLYRLETLSDDGVRIKLDDEIIIDNWLPQAVTQNTTMVEIKPGMHKLRFEYFEDLGPSRLSLSIRCIDPNQAELKELESVNSKESAEIRKQRESIDYLRSIGVYLFEELNAPTPKIYRVDLAEADPSKIDSTTIDRLMEFPAIRYLTVGPNAWNAKDWERLANLRSLQRLHLEYRSIDLDEFASVATFTQVKELSVLGNKLGDKEVEILSAMPNIQLLSFWYTELTDSCFETLAKMPNLREFHQGGSKITESAQRDFQAKLAEKQKR